MKQLPLFNIQQLFSTDTGGNLANLHTTDLPLILSREADALTSASGTNDMARRLLHYGDADGAVIKQYLADIVSEAETKLMNIISRRFGRIHPQNGYQYYAAPDNMDVDEFLSRAAQIVRMYVIYRAITRMLSNVEVNIAQRYEARAEEQFAELTKALNIRHAPEYVRPTAKTPTPTKFE